MEEQSARITEGRHSGTTHTTNDGDPDIAVAQRARIIDRWHSGTNQTNNDYTDIAVAQSDGITTEDRHSDTTHTTNDGDPDRVAQCLAQCLRTIERLQSGTTHTANEELDLGLVKRGHSYYLVMYGHEAPEALPPGVSVWISYTYTDPGRWAAVSDDEELEELERIWNENRRQDDWNENKDQDYEYIYDTDECQEAEEGGESTSEWG